MALSSIGDLAVAVLAFAELLLQLVQLLAQHRFTLALAERSLRLLLDVAGDLQHLHAMREELHHLVEPLLEVKGREQILLLLRLDVHEAHDQVSKLARRVDATNGPRQLGGHLRQQRQRFHRPLLEKFHARLDVGALFLRLGQGLDTRGEERSLAHDLQQAEPAFTLTDKVMRAVGRGHVADHGGKDAQVVEVRHLGLFEGRIALQQKADLASGAHRFLGRGNALLTAERDGQHDAGEEHDVTHRHQRHGVGRQRWQFDTRSCWGLVGIRHKLAIPGQPDFEAAVLVAACRQLEWHACQRNASNEASVRNLETSDYGVRRAKLERTHCADNQLRRLERQADLLRNHTGKRKEQNQAVGGLLDIDRRLPYRGIDSRPHIAQELALQALGPVQDLACLHPHPAVLPLTAHSRTRTANTAPAAYDVAG